MLFNVESVRRNGENTQWFPFDKFKFGKGGKVTWSLEHIHAQQSEGLRTQEMWKEWLRLHIPSVQAVGSDCADLIAQMQAAIAKEKLERTEFDTLQTLTDKYITACEAAGLYPWRYYYVKYPVFRPGVYGKLSNSHADEKPYLFSVMQTKTQWSSNTYMPYLKAADGAHLSKDFMGQRLIYGDRHIICANNAYLLRNNDDESVIDIVRISQSEVGIDLEDRIKKLKAYITTL